MPSSKRALQTWVYSPWMAIWFPAPSLDPAEVVVFQASANLLRGRRSIGGQITVTDKRFHFVPNRLDGLTGARSVAIAKSDITRVAEEPAGGDALKKRGLAASIRPQLKVEYSGQNLVVIVRDLGALTASLVGSQG
jgi:hypothetical protein